MPILVTTLRTANKKQKNVFPSTGTHLGTKEAHAEHVERLSLHVLGPHVDNALQAKSSADSGCGDAVLPGTSLGDDSLLAHT